MDGNENETTAETPEAIHPPTQQSMPDRATLRETCDLSEEIIKDIELSQMPLANVALKCLRLARLLNDSEAQTIFAYEIGGYPSNPSGVYPDAWQAGGKAKRHYETIGFTANITKTVMYTESIGVLEQRVNTSATALEVAKDPDVSISSANPNQMVFSPVGNVQERREIRGSIVTARKQLEERRIYLYQYSLHKHYELKFSEVAHDVFASVRTRVDAQIGQHVPDAVQRFSSAYDNLTSENPEDWSNAAHSCRRILKDLADSLFPVTTPPSERKSKSGKSITLGDDQYINRIVAFIGDNSSSERFTEIVGSHLDYLGNRLDSVAKASHKGTHTTIVTRVEAERYVIYTYLLVGDILSILPK